MAAQRNRNRLGSAGKSSPRETKFFSPTLDAYAPRWLATRRVTVRVGLSRCNEQHLRCYLLPEIGRLRLDEITPRALLQLRVNLMSRVAVSTARLIVGGTLRALLRDARVIDEYLETDPFLRLPPWPKPIAPRPDPLTVEERDKILAHFRSRPGLRHLHPLVATLLLTGMRPSEALALRWGDVDLSAARISITKSRVAGQESPPKTARSNRTIDIRPEVVAILAPTQPMHATHATYVFPKAGSTRPIDQKAAAIVWRRAIRALGIRQRKFYATRATFISVALSRGINLKWLADYCGTSVVRIETNYARWLEVGTISQLALLDGGAGTNGRVVSVGSGPVGDGGGATHAL